MKKQLLLFMLLLPLVATTSSAHDIEVKNADGVTIYYNYNNDGTELSVTFRGSTYHEYNEYSGTVVIPEEVTYMGVTRKVTSIGDNAFWNSSVTSVTIPNSVKSIGVYAFRNCGLTSVTIGNSVTSIGSEAFRNCGLTSVIIPNSVTSIGYDAFENCSKLTSVTIGNSVKSIGVYAFRNCGLTSVTIPNSVTSIGEGAFNGCTGLTSVTIGNSVTTIGIGAFYGCTVLTSVTIPNSVTSIGEGAFGGCDMTTVISQITEPFVIVGKAGGDNRTFSLNTFNNAKLYVPEGTIEKYKAKNGWKDFLFIMEGGSTQKCEKPAIGYQNGKLTFKSATDGVTYQYSINDTDIKSGSGSEVQLTVTYNIAVYATKAGYMNSETAYATLCWIDVEPQKEGISDGIANVQAKAVLIQSQGGVLNIQGIDDGTEVSVYGVNGTRAGSAVCHGGQAVVSTSLQPGTVAIVKIGQRSVKVAVK